MHKNVKKVLIKNFIGIVVSIVTLISSLQENNLGFSLIVAIITFAFFWFVDFCLDLLSKIIVKIATIPRIYTKIAVWLIAFPVLFYFSICAIRWEFINITALSGEQWINIFGGILAYYGSCVIGMIAFWQTNKAHELSLSLFQNELKSNKGYFEPVAYLPYVLGERPFPIPYDLTDSISFTNKGNDCVVIEKTKLFMKDKLIEVCEGMNLFFSYGDSEFRHYGFETGLTEDDLLDDTIKLNIELFLKNSKGYCYVQKIFLEFKKVTELSNLYNIYAFNMEIVEEKNEIE